MAVQILINLNDSEESTLKATLQYQDGVTKETFNEIVEEYIRLHTLDPIMKSYVRLSEIEKITSIIATKQEDVTYKKTPTINPLLKK